jgi:hypothetical protein
MKMLLCFLLMLGMTLTATAADVNGKWSGSFNVTRPDGEVKEDTAFFVLKQNGLELTGTVGPSEEEQFPIEKGKIEGDKITMEASAKGSIIKFELVLAGDHIKGDANGDHDGQPLKAKLDLTRVK